MNKYSLILVALLVGCSTPETVKTNVASIIPAGGCYDFFVKSGLGTYQHNAQMINAKASFALALDENKHHVCGVATRKEVCDDTWTTDCSWEKVEALSISRCELARERSGFSVKASCRPFARNNELVWDSYKGGTVDLQ